ncbi:GntR family transcriptional regulator [Echinicola strongylocentroti]|uniref:GntR family transcriptional regulator n=1 Tax=Echinicola strongylocentroti TaxID=1795355 RepID=A0A2Z4ICV0_9BACT|nr:FadR/GntR family transcriptional regulator [Echinicola strongylocentroti]AWW28792.1 GntR family transcriptional regulator [Echinicola strongylocentroti]
MELLSNFSQIEIETPVDKIINQIKNLITSGQLQPGDRLPPERKLCEKLGVGRTHLRDAIKKLEFYGILKTLPQSGTVVAGMGITALEGLISDVLRLEGSDFKSLVETRVILETQSASLAAERRSDEDLKEIERAMKTHMKKVKEGHHGVEEDLMFHLKIAEASKNSVLTSLMLIITPDILSYFKQHDVCGEGRYLAAAEEHEVIFEHIKNQNTEAVALMMNNHLKNIQEFAETRIERFNISTKINKDVLKKGASEENGSA